MKTYLVDVGVLLEKQNDELQNDEFNFYSCVYDHKYGYYDEHQYYVSTKEEAIKQAKEYVVNGIEGTYGVVSLTTLNDEITTQDIDDGNVDVSNETYALKDVCVGYAKLNNQVCRIL